MRKPILETLVNEKFEGKYWLAANEMVRLFVDKYGISGSIASYDFYPKVQRLWKRILKEEKVYWKKQERIWRDYK